VGIFGREIDDEVVDLKWELVSLNPYVLESSSFAKVDCRLCNKTDNGVLLNEVVWGMQTCKASYAWCKKNQKWVAETQGNGLAGRTDHSPSRTTWSVFDPSTDYAVWFTGLGVETVGLPLPSRAVWAMGDFQERIAGTKLIVEDFLRAKADPEYLSRLEQLLRDDPI